MGSHLSKSRNFTDKKLYCPLTIAVTSAGALFLAGCGGGGNNGGGSGSNNFASRQVTVQLPTGFSLPLNTLVAESGKSASALDTSGNFTTQVPNSTVTSLATIRDKAGRGVLVGFVPTNGTPLTPRSAAVALLYYALGGFMLPEASRRPLVTLLEADATTVTLGATISQKLLGNPYVLEADDADINTALKAAYDTLVATGRAVRTESFTQALTRATVDPLLQIQPGGLQSNLEVLQATAATTFTVTNHSRRYCRVYTYQTGNPDALPKAILQGDPVKLDSTTALGVFSTINNLISGQTAYVPVVTAPIALPLASGSTKTLYEIIVVGASNLDNPRGFYSDAKYVDEQAKWVKDQADLSMLTWWQNLILPCFFEALGIAGLAAATVAVESSLAALQAIGEQSVKDVLFSAGKGSYIAAAGAFWSLAAESTAVGEKVRQALIPLYEAAVGQIAAETAAARLALFARLVVRAAIAAVVLLGAGDIGAVLADTTTAQPAEQWFATVLQPTLILDPTSKTIVPGQRVTFSVKPPVGTVGTISYAWTQTGATSTLSSSDGVVGNTITTTSTSVDLVTTQSDSGTITVTVVATLTAPNATQSELGTAQATITIQHTSTTISQATPQIISSPITTGEGASQTYMYALFTVAVPSTGWTTAQMTYSDGTYDVPFGSVLEHVFYDQGAPVVGEGVDHAQWKPYYGRQTGTSQWVNLGGSTVGFIFLGSGEIRPGFEQDSRDALQKQLDKIVEPKTLFS